MELQKSNRIEAQSIYKTLDYKWNINSDDYILLAKAKNKTIGIVRIREEKGFPILRGMFLNKTQYRQDNIESMLLELEEHLRGRESYCLPPVHLKKYYQLFGYEPIEINQAPLFLKKQLISFNKPRPYSFKRERVIIMKKTGFR